MLSVPIYDNCSSTIQEGGQRAAVSGSCANTKRLFENGLEAGVGGYYAMYLEISEVVWYFGLGEQ